MTSKYIEEIMPDELIIKDDIELKKKLKERINKIGSGKAKCLQLYIFLHYKIVMFSKIKITTRK